MQVRQPAARLEGVPLSKAEIDELNAILRMPKAERDKAEAADRAKLKANLRKLLGIEEDVKTSQQKATREKRKRMVKVVEQIIFREGKPNDTPVETASLSQSAPLPQKQPPAKDIWTVKPGQSAAYHVPYEVNRRHRSPKRRYRDKEVAHGFPVANLREFFFSSRRLASAAYDAPNRRLYLKFDASTLYQYFDVPENVARDLLKMVSPGSYAYRHICYAFKYERLPFPPPPTVKAKTGSRAKASISQERRNELASLSPEQLKARLEKNEKRRMEILAKLLGKDKPTDTPTARPDQEAK